MPPMHVEKRLLQSRRALKPKQTMRRLQHLITLLRGLKKNLLGLKRLTRPLHTDQVLVPCQALFAGSWLSSIYLIHGQNRMDPRHMPILWRSKQSVACLGTPLRKHLKRVAISGRWWECPVAGWFWFERPWSWLSKPSCIILRNRP